MLVHQLKHVYRGQLSHLQGISISAPTLLGLVLLLLVHVPDNVTMEIIIYQIDGGEGRGDLCSSRVGASSQ